MSGAGGRISRSSGASSRSGRARWAHARAPNLTITTPSPILVPSLLAPPFPSEPLLEHLRPSRLPRVRLELVSPSPRARPAAAPPPPAPAPPPAAPPPPPSPPPLPTPMAEGPVFHLGAWDGSAWRFDPSLDDDAYRKSGNVPFVVRIDRARPGATYPLVIRYGCRRVAFITPHR